MNTGASGEGDEAWTALQQDEIERYQRLRGSVTTTRSRESRIVSLIVLAIVLTAALFVAYIYHQLDMAMQSLQGQVTTLSLDERGYSEISDQMFELQQGFKTLRGDLDRVWNLASKEQATTLEAMQQQTEGVKRHLEELQSGLAGISDKTEAYEIVQRTVKSLSASILSLEGSYEHALERIEKSNQERLLLDGRVESTERAINAIDKDRQRRARQLISIERRLQEKKS